MESQPRSAQVLRDVEAAAVRTFPHDPDGVPGGVRAGREGRRCGLLARHDRDARPCAAYPTRAPLGVVPIPPLFISFYFMRLDRRGRAFVDTANTRLLLIEREWQ